MTQKLYDIDSHIKEFTATVLSCDGNVAVLDKTAFFAEGGGQSADTGLIDGVKVLDVQIKDGVIYHYLEQSLEVGKTVECKLDWEKRFRKMQNHSGEHIISGIVHSLYGYENVGFHLGETEMTMDFDGILTKEDLKKVEKLANEAIYKNAKFKCFYPESLENLQYRAKLDLKEDVRIVEIEGYDRCACCAPHVNSACEIGVIKIISFCKNKGGVRLFVKCGIDALENYYEQNENSLKISSLLCTPQNEIVSGVEKQLEQMGNQKFEITNLKRRLIDEVSKNFQSESKISLLFEDGFDIKELGLLSDALHKRNGGIRGVFSGEDNSYSFAICGNPQELDAFFKAFKEKINVRGGGRNGMVQGTAMATKQQILEFAL